MDACLFDKVHVILPHLFDGLGGLLHASPELIRLNMIAHVQTAPVSC